MHAILHDVLASIGPLDDRAGADTPRRRFHRLIDEQATDVRRAAELLSQCQERLGRQHACARQDLVVKLGEFLGFQPEYGACAPAHDPPETSGRWRSPAGPIVLLDVRSERTAGDNAETLARAVDAMSSHTGPGGPRPAGLVVVTPFYMSRAPLDAWLSRHQRSDIRCVSLDSLLWLAEARTASQLPHEEVLRLLTTGPDADFMIALARRLSRPPDPGAAAPRTMPAPATALPPASPAGHLIHGAREGDVGAVLYPLRESDAGGLMGHARG